MKSFGFQVVQFA